ncbi:hypothetical protein [Bosea sp. TAF32]|uniref:hypothetical protein n=1 Tax=Bosea sp. TAF32 TaxID=3237482 RepID=UPI003F9238C2
MTGVFQRVTEAVSRVALRQFAPEYDKRRNVEWSSKWINGRNAKSEEEPHVPFEDIKNIDEDSADLRGHRGRYFY